MGQYKEIYAILDPILKENAGITFPEFQERYPKLKITYGSFNRRKLRLFSNKQLKKARSGSYKKLKPVKTTTYGKMSGELTAQIKEAVLAIVPKTKNMKEYMIVGQILMDDPNTVHSRIKKSHNLKMCDANYYVFRKKFCRFLGLNLTSTYSKKEDKVKTGVKVKAEDRIPRRKASLYTVLYERDAVGLTSEAKDLVTDIFGALSQERVVNLEMVEIVHPKNIIEIRSYGK